MNIHKCGTSKTIMGIKNKMHFMAFCIQLAHVVLSLYDSRMLKIQSTIALVNWFITQ